MSKKAIKRLAVPVAIALLLGLIATGLVGWLLSHPAQTKVGSAPENLGAETITIPSDSGANVAAWWCPFQTVAVQSSCCPEFAPIDGAWSIAPLSCVAPVTPPC